MKKIWITIALLSFFLFVAVSFGHKGMHVYKVGVGQILFPAILDELSSARVTFVGEKHDNPGHHKTQLEVIKGLHEKGFSLIVGLEMFTARDQKKLEAWAEGSINEKDFALVFKQNWGFDWGLYRDIFLFARNEKIPLIGLNVPREITRKVARGGFQSLNDKDLEALPPGISCDLDQRYMDFIRRLYSFKGGKDKSFVNFCEAQVVWDQSMAWYLAKNLKKNPTKKAVVLAGAVHSWKYGISRQLQKYLNLESKVILPGLPGDYQNISTEDADYLVLHL